MYWGFEYRDGSSAGSGEIVCDDPREDYKVQGKS